MIIKTKVKKIKNSLCILFSKKLIRKEDLRVGDELFLLKVEKLK